MNEHMLMNVGLFDKNDRTLFNKSVLSTRENVAATCLLMHHMPVLRGKFIENGWYDVPLSCWIGLGQWIDLVNMIGSIKDVPDTEIAMLRGLKKCIVRWTKDADYKKELENRQKKPLVHLFPHLGSKSMEKWDEVFRVTTDNVLKELFKVMGTRRSGESINNWWKKRAINIASGSTHMRNLADTVSDTPISDKSDRADKKCVIQHLPDNYLENIVAHMFPRNLGHLSTKQEPGGKQRALIASNDLEYFVSSYASMDLEKHLHFDGMMGKQGITDVADWIYSSEIYKGSVHVCADFDDFNTTHTMDCLFYLNYSLAVIHYDTLKAVDMDVAVDKHNAHVWTALSQYNSWTVLGNDDPNRVFNGLFSGSRNTARDNTLLHGIYAKMNEWLLKDLYNIQLNVPKKWIAGDDEDYIFTNISQAKLWCDAYVTQGHAMNPSKQSMSTVRHEFLKVYHVLGVGANRPLGSILATLATGNWYVPSATWYLEAPESVASNFADAVGRGMHYDVAQKMAIQYLDTIMRIHEKDGTKLRINWWPHAKQSSVSCAFWEGSNAGDKPWPIIKTKPRYPDQLACQASNAFKKTYETLLNQMTSNQQETVDAELRHTTYGKTFHRHRLNLALEDARGLTILKHGEMVNRQVTEAKMPLMVPWNRKITLFAAISQRTVTSTSLDESFARIGVPPVIGNILGPTRVLRTLSNPRMWSFWASPEPVIAAKIDITTTAMLRASAATAAAASKITIVNKPITVYIAPNGAGKTTWCQKNVDALDVDTCIDDKEWFGLHTSTTSITRFAIAKRIVEHALNQNYRSIVTQRLGPEIVECLKSVKMLEKVVLVQPPEGELRVRLLARGWNENKIAFRKKQFANQIGELTKKTSVITVKQF